MKWLVWTLALACLANNSQAFAWDEDDENKTLSYEEIVADLKSQTSMPATKVKKEREDGDSKVFFGIAYGLSQVESAGTANDDTTYKTSMMMQGTQFTLGTDFTHNVSGEAIYRNFYDQEAYGNHKVSLQEIEGRLIYRPRLNDNSRARLGAGLVSRSLDVVDSNSSNMLIRWSIGFERKVNEWLRLIPEISYRNNLVTNKIDQPGVDAGVGFQVIF